MVVDFLLSSFYIQFVTGETHTIAPDVPRHRARLPASQARNRPFSAFRSLLDRSHWCTCGGCGRSCGCPCAQDSSSTSRRCVCCVAAAAGAVDRVELGQSGILLSTHLSDGCARAQPRSGCLQRLLNVLARLRALRARRVARATSRRRGGWCGRRWRRRRRRIGSDRRLGAGRLNGGLDAQEHAAGGEGAPGRAGAVRRDGAGRAPPRCV